MAPRILLGNRAGVMGLFVSRPGQNVLTSSDFMMSTAVKNLQVVERGSFGVIFGSPGVTFGWSALGFTPRVLIQTAHQITSLVYNSSTSATVRFQSMQSQLDQHWRAGAPIPVLSNTVYWSVLSVPH